MSSEDIFYFKKFKIIQNAASVFKVNIEAVLLSAWTDIVSAHSIFEIGCGSGVISIGLIQRIKSSTTILAIDIDENAIELTQKNITINKSPQIEAIQFSLQDFYAEYPEKKFDLIISNPPYYSTALKSEKKRNQLSKYTDTLDYQTLLSLSNSMLENDGSISIIIPYHDLSQIESISKSLKLYFYRTCYIYSSHKKAPLRTMIQLEKKDRNLTEHSEFYIKDIHGNFTPEYIALTREYYTIF